MTTKNSSSSSHWRELCRKGETRRFTLRAAALERMQSFCHAPLELANAEFTGTEVERADGTVEHRFTLTVSAQATLRCQRCLGALPQVLGASREFVLVKDEAALQAYDEAHEDDDEAPEALAADAGQGFEELAEEELILAVPLVPRHLVCPAALAPHLMDAAGRAVGPEGSQDIVGEPEKVSPFANLAALVAKNGGTKSSKN